MATATAISSLHVVVAKSFGKTRLRERRVDEFGAAEYVARRAQQFHDWAMVCRHGGGVCNSYNYPAETEGVIAVADPQGRVVVWCGRLSAKGVTLAGVAARLIGEEVRPLWDGRRNIAAEQRKAEAMEFLRAAHDGIIAEEELNDLESGDFEGDSGDNDNDEI